MFRAGLKLEVIDGVEWAWIDIDGCTLIAEFEDNDPTKLKNPSLINPEILAIIAKIKNWGIVTHRSTYTIEKWLKERSKVFYPYYKQNYKCKNIVEQDDGTITETFEVPSPLPGQSVEIKFHLKHTGNGTEYILENLMTFHIKETVERLTDTKCAFVCTADCLSQHFQLRSHDIVELFKNSYQFLEGFEKEKFKLSSERLGLTEEEFKTMIHDKNLQYLLSSKFIMAESPEVAKTSCVHIHGYDDVLDILKAIKEYSLSKHPDWHPKMHFHAYQVDRKHTDPAYQFSMCHTGWYKAPNSPPLAKVSENKEQKLEASSARVPEPILVAVEPSMPPGKASVVLGTSVIVDSASAAALMSHHLHSGTIASGVKRKLDQVEGLDQSLRVSKKIALGST